VTISPLIFVAIILLTAIVASGLTALVLRRRDNASSGLQLHEQETEQEQTSLPTQPNFVGPEFRPVKLAFGTSEGAPAVMEISALRAGALPQKKRQLDPTSVRLKTFTPLLQLIPRTLTAAAYGQGDFILIMVRGPLALASEPQSLIPFVHGAQGQVEELGRLRNGDPLRQLISSGMGWQLAFIVVARKHLVDVDKTLDYIKRGVGEIKTFLKNERRSKIAGTLDYLCQVVATLGHQESPAALRNQLEHIERELLQFQNHIMRDLGASTDKIGTIIQGRFTRRKTLVNAINQRADEMYELEKEWLLCVLARAVNWQVLSVFPGDKQFKITRKASLYKSIDEFTGFLQQVYKQLHEKITTVRSALDSISTKQQDKSVLVQFDLRRRLMEDNNRICSDAHVIREEIRAFANRLWSPQKPIVVAVKLDRGRIAEAFEIEAS
jgi:hypothetical protein